MIFNGILYELVPNPKQQEVPMIMLIHPDGRKESWGDVEDFDDLFKACHERWGGNWDLNKVCVAIKESEID